MFTHLGNAGEDFVAHLLLTLRARMENGNTEQNCSARGRLTGTPGGQEKCQDVLRQMQHEFGSAQDLSRCARVERRSGLLRLAEAYRRIPQLPQERQQLGSCLLLSQCQGNYPQAAHAEQLVLDCGVCVERRDDIFHCLMCWCHIVLQQRARAAAAGWRARADLAAPLP